MTDKERFVQLMADFGVPLRHTTTALLETLTIVAEDKVNTDKIKGYWAFETEFGFDAKTGQFISVGLWE